MANAIILVAKSFFLPPSPSPPVGGRGDKRKLLANAICHSERSAASLRISAAKKERFFAARQNDKIVFWLPLGMRRALVHRLKACATVRRRLPYLIHLEKFC